MSTAAKALLPPYAPAPALSLLEETHSSARLSSTIGRPVGGGVGGLKGAVDVSKAGFSEVIDSLGAGSKRAQAARVLFADAAAQAAAARGVAPPLPGGGGGGSGSPRRRGASTPARSPRATFTARLRGTVAAATAHGNPLSSPLRPGFRAPLGLASFNWTGFLAPPATRGGVRDELLDAPLPPGAEHDPTLRALLRVQRARVLAAAHATVGARPSTSPAKVQSPLPQQQPRARRSFGDGKGPGGGGDGGGGGDAWAAPLPPPPASVYEPRETDGRWVTRALFRTPGGAPGFDGSVGGRDAGAVAAAAAAAGESGYGWRAGSARAFSTGAPLAPRAPRLPSAAELRQGQIAWAAAAAARRGAAAARVAGADEESAAAAARAAARAALMGASPASREAFFARSRALAVVVHLALVVGSLRCAVGAADAEAKRAAAERSAGYHILAWYRHVVRLIARRKRRRAHAVVAAFLMRVGARVRAARRRTAARTVVAFLSAARNVTPGARLLLQYRRYVGALGVVKRYLRGAIAVRGALSRVAVAALCEEEARARRDVARALAAAVLAAAAAAAAAPPPPPGADGTLPSAAPPHEAPPRVAALWAVLGLGGEGRGMGVGVARALRRGRAREVAAAAAAAARGALALAALPPPLPAAAEAGWLAFFEVAAAPVPAPPATFSLAAAAAVVDGAAGVADLLRGVGAEEADAAAAAAARAAAAAAEAVAEAARAAAPHPSRTPLQLLLAGDAPPPAPPPAPPRAPPHLARLAALDAEHLALTLARWALPPAPLELLRAKVRAVLEARRRERKALLWQWKTRCVALAPFMAGARRLAARAVRFAATEEAAAAEGGGAPPPPPPPPPPPWPPARPSLARLPPRDTLRAVAYEALEETWGLGVGCAGVGAAAAAGGPAHRAAARFRASSPEKISPR